jgi:hypothetical protein
MKQLIVLLLLSAAALGDDISILHVIHHPKDPAKRVTVLFDNPPAQTLATDKRYWTARCFRGEAALPTTLLVESADHGNSAFNASPTVNLVFDQEVVDCTAVEVTLLTEKFPSQRWTKPQQPKPVATPTPASAPSLWSRLFEAPGGSQKGDPDYSFSGTVVAGVGTKPLYTIDGSFLTRIKRGNSVSLAATETVKSSSSAIDPDSFNSAITLLYTSAARHQNIFMAKSNLAGLEFNKASSVLNEVSSGAFTWMRFKDWTSCLDKDKAKDPTCPQDLTSSMQFSLSAGIETGNNFKNSFTAVNRPGLAHGSGLIFRGVPSAGLFFNIFPGGDTKHAIRLNSSYTLRLPARDEIFLETRRHTTNPVPLLETNPRHYVENNLIFQFNDFLGLKIQHSYGALPPTFLFNDQRISTGIVFQAFQPR